MPKNKNTEPAPIHSMNYTFITRLELGDYLDGRKIIGRDEDVRGGVYYNYGGGEAIVVDPEKYPDEYNRYYNKAVELATTDGKIDRSKVLDAVFRTVESEMAYSQDGVDSVLQKVANRLGESQFQERQKVELGSFMGHGVGVCRHMALAEAAILWRFKDEGYISGDISVDRNTRYDPGKDKSDAHAWLRVTEPGKPVMIADVAHHFLGPIDDPKARWDYRRPEEHVADELRKRTQKPLGRHGLLGLLGKAKDNLVGATH